MARSADLEEGAALALSWISLSSILRDRSMHRYTSSSWSRSRPWKLTSVAVRAGALFAVDHAGLHFGRIIASGTHALSSSAMTSKTARLSRWDEIALEK